MLRVHGLKWEGPESIGKEISCLIELHRGIHEGLDCLLLIELYVRVEDLIKKAEEVLQVQGSIVPEVFRVPTGRSKK